MTMNSFQDILESAKKNGARRIAVPFPGREDLVLLSKAAALGYVVPSLIGSEKSLKAAVGRMLLASLDHEIVEEKDRKAALIRAMAQVREGRADILMQGGVSQQAFMAAVLDKNHGLVKGKVASHVSIVQLLKRDKLVLVTDTFLNNHPAIGEKQAILENAIQLARMLGMEAPNVAVLAAIEQVNPGIPSTLDAAILSKMSERRQFGKAVVEGPLDMDCALSQVAASRKGLQSVVTGNVDIYVVPEVDTGYLLAEALVFFGKMQTAGVIMGTAKPVILNLPFVSSESRMVEIALASLICGKGENDG